MMHRSAQIGIAKTGDLRLAQTNDLSLAQMWVTRRAGGRCRTGFAPPEEASLLATDKPPSPWATKARYVSYFRGLFCLGTNRSTCPVDADRREGDLGGISSRSPPHYERGLRVVAECTGVGVAEAVDGLARLSAEPRPVGLDPVAPCFSAGEAAESWKQERFAPRPPVILLRHVELEGVREAGDRV